MLSWKPFKAASAFKLYCRGIGMNISEYADVSENLEKYKDDPKWRDHIKKSERFIGVIDTVSESPCSMLLYDKPVDSEIGMVRTPKGEICCLLDGNNCDKFKYLKNDYLTVTVWAIIRDVCKLANIPIPTIKEMDQLLDDQTYDIYKNGLTSTINQADSDFGTATVMTYCPHSVSEMSAFVAILRPGCASLRQDFIDRKPYSTGIKELDDLLIEGNHRMIYQELIMKYLIWLGIPETGSYDIIKKISKKKFKEEELNELKSNLLSGWMERVGTEDRFTETWTVVEQAAHYSFNASHSLSYAYDSLYGAYLKSHYPLEYYTVALRYYADDSERTMKLTNELPYFGLSLKSVKFRYSGADYEPSSGELAIYKGIKSVKEMNGEIAEQMYALRNDRFDSFIDLLFTLKEKTTIKKNQIEGLIHLDFFSEFGDANSLLQQLNLFLDYYGKKSISKEKWNNAGLSSDIAEKHSGRITEKLYMDVDMKSILREAASSLSYKKRTVYEKVRAQVKYLGYVDVKDENYSMMAVVLKIDTKYTPRVRLYSLKYGSITDCKIEKKVYNKCSLEEGDTIRILKWQWKPKSVKKPDTNEWEPIPGTKEMWIRDYLLLS